MCRDASLRGLLAALAVLAAFLSAGPAGAAAVPAAPAALPPAAPAEAPAARIATPGALLAALEAAGAGRGPATLLLAPGRYGRLVLDANRAPWARFPRPVTIRSADPADPAVFASIALVDVSDLALEDVRLAFATERRGAKAMRRATGLGIWDSRRVAIRGGVFEGTAVEDPGSVYHGWPAGTGMMIRGSTDVLVEGARVADWGRGIAIHRSERVTVRQSEITRIRMDGLRVSQGTDVLVEGNRFHGFRAPSGTRDHRDMIQAWTTRTDAPTERLTIRANRFDSAGGVGTQTIFMGNELVARGAGRELYYRDVLIEGNLIRNGHLHGISVAPGIGVEIRDNTLLLNADTAHTDRVWAPRIDVSPRSERVTVTGNVASRWPEETAPGWRIGGNLRLQYDDPAAPGHADALLVNAEVGAAGTLADIAPRPGGPLDPAGGETPGSDLLAPGDGLVALAEARPARDAPGTVILDAGASRDADGPLAGREGVRFLWETGDGGRAEGARAAHAYAGPGDYPVRLTVVLPDGRRATARSRARLPEPVRLAIDAGADGPVDATPGREAAPLAGEAGAASHAGRRGIRTGPGTGAATSAAAASGVGGLERFALSLDLAALGGRESAGEILRIHRTLRVAVGPDGAVSVSVRDTEGRRTALESRGSDLLDGRWHSIAVLYEAGGRARLLLDGREAASAPAGGRLPSAGRHGLSLGAIWNAAGFDGLLDDIAVADRAAVPGTPGAPELPFAAAR